MSLPLPICENDRLEALKRTQVLEMPSLASGDLYVDIAAEIMRTPISAITLIDQDTQWLKASRGMAGVTQTGRAVAFCAYAIKQPSDVLCVPDARQDPRFAQNPLVTGAPRIRFYTGVPLLTAEGYPMGALCVIDVVPGQISENQILKLRSLAKMVAQSLLLGGATYKMNCRVRAFSTIATGKGINDNQQPAQRFNYGTTKSSAPAEPKALAWEEALATIGARLSAVSSPC